MNDLQNWTVPKWPFWLGYLLLLGFACFIITKSHHPISNWEVIACFATATIGALIGILPYYLDYRATEKALEVSALGEVAEKISDLEKLSAQIGSATNHWAVIQETVQKESGQTAAIAKDIAWEVGIQPQHGVRQRDTAHVAKEEIERPAQIPAGRVDVHMHGIVWQIRAFHIACELRAHRVGVGRSERCGRRGVGGDRQQRQQQEQQKIARSCTLVGSHHHMPYQE